MREQRHPHIHVDPRRPRDGTRPTVNPPLFAWKPRRGERGFALTVARDPGLTDAVLRLEGLTEPLHLPERALPAGTYWWQWQAGEDRSEVFRFEIDAAATRLEVPPADEWLRRWPAGHPRLHVDPEGVEAVRDRAAAEQPEATLQLLALADELVGAEHHIEEPPFLPDRNQDFEANRAVWYPTMWGSRAFVKGAETLALAYLLTGDETYGRPACERMASISRWDPDGSTWLGHNDEAHMSVIWHGPHAVDWAWDCFTDEERRRVIEQFRRRGQITYEHMHDRGAYGIDRFDSHAGREIVFLALIAVAFHEHIPEAATWLAWLRPVLCGVWPIWARDDGGWAQGPSYGLAYVGIQQMFASAFKRGTGVDVYRRPFWRNHARWRRWVLPPYAEWQGFGDHTQRWRSSWQRNADLVELIGLETGTDEFDGYVAGLRGQSGFQAEPPDRHLPGINAHLFLARLQPDASAGAPSATAARGPAEASHPERGTDGLTQPRFGDGFDPSSSMLKVFPAVGWAALRTRPANEAHGAGDVAVLFRSSPLGSISHSHANNNDFVLHVGGRAMAMPSGFYGGVKLGYGGEHHANWVWHTKSHNCVTLSDAGQIMRSEESTGAVAHACEDEQLAYWVGVADASYADRADRCRRHMLFLKETSALVLIDEFVSRGAMLSTLQFNLHAMDPFEVDRPARTFAWRRGKSAVTGTFLYHANATFTLTEGWEPAPERAESEEPYPMQYHLRFTCNSKTADYQGPRHRLLERAPIRRTLATVLAPSAPGIRRARVAASMAGECEVGRVGDARVVVHPDGGPLRVDGQPVAAAGDAAVAAVDIGGRRYVVDDGGIRTTL